MRLDQRVEVAAVNTLATGLDLRHMSVDAYKRERDEIRATYGDSSVEAAALRDQALAALFYRSGWTLDELATVEGMSNSHIAKKLRFGRFLVFCSTGTFPRNLTERRFRGYWEQTDKSEGNERKRFLEVQRLLQTETVIRAPRRAGLGVKIVAEFGDNKWHKLETIAAHVEQPPESLIPLLSNMNCANNNWGVVLCERKRVGAKDGTWYKRAIAGEPTHSGDDIYEAFNQPALHPFLLWLGELFTIKTPELRRTQFVAAMYATFIINEGEAKKFWDQVARGGIEYEDSAPSTVLDNWLKAIKQGEIEDLKPGEFYQGCVYAWNAYRDAKPIKEIKHDTKKSWYVPHE